jgi:hypothetical protein
MRRAYLGLLVGVAACAACAVKPALAAPPVLNTPLRVMALPGNGATLITFGTVPGATGYNVYRRAHGEAADKAVKVNAQPSPYGWLIDAGADNAGLPNGTNFIYSVKAVLTDGSEGPASEEVLVRPQVPLGGAFFVHDIGTLNPSTVSLSEDGKVLTVRASGGELWDNQDAGTFIGTAVAGDYSVSAKVLERPVIQEGGSNSAKAGVIIREGLERFSRNAYNFVSASREPAVRYEGLISVPGADAVNFSGGSDEDATLAYPRWLRLTKDGNAITAFHSTDGTNWKQTIEGEDGKRDFLGLSPVTYAGLTTVALVDGTYVEAKYDATYGHTGILIERP